MPNRSVVSDLAVLGGRPVRSRPFPPHPVLGEEEKKAVAEVLESGNLSAFLASPSEYFLGGRRIKELERRFADYHGTRFAVAFNSATAALHAAVVAVGVQPGEEVIVPPYTFTATATSVLMHNAVPVFADVDADTFALRPEATAAAITDLTRAIIPVHLFGHPADMDGFTRVARERGLKIIEDCAQSPGARLHGRPVGTFGDCGIFSLTETKTITCGEGGVLITNDEAIAHVARLVRNHGEAISEHQKARTYVPVILGWNYRMTEIEAAIAAVQLDRLDGLNAQRREFAAYLTRELSGLPGVIPPVERAGATHVYQIYAVKIEPEALGISHHTFAKALTAEGIPFGAGYVPPLYMSPVYQERKAFVFQHYQGTARYEAGMCPVTERLHARELCLTQVVRPPATMADMKDIVDAFHKVVENRERLRSS